MSTSSTPPDGAPAAWSGRFSEPVSEIVKRYTASIPFDYRLAEFDIQGSLAHAAMLHHVGVLSKDDLEAIRRGMAELLAEIRAGQFSWSLDKEDVHLNIEAALTAKIGDAGKRLHTGRSRNDQVATDIRLYLRDAIDRILGGLRACQTSLVDLAEQHADTVMPGFTHLQVAQPVTFGHHLLAYFEMLARDAERMGDCRRRVNRLPLGAAALAGRWHIEDADLDTYLDKITEVSLLGSGQGCLLSTRLLVARSRHDELCDRLRSHLAGQVVGDPLDPATTYGPVSLERQRDRVEGYIRIGREEGARVLVGGGRPAGLDRGFFVEPTVFVGVDNGMRIAREEIFGPVLTVTPFDDEDEAVALANDSEYGLGGSVFTADREHGVDVARRVQTGTIGVN
ncbi:MAG: aldehyde dehydrogenase family protein, partial [Thiobacillus sp.]|nr:aldehyde dehydrogenase family protein [Thiobacillus sp.]